jgi:hypothetical protein
VAHGLIQVNDRWGRTSALPARLSSGLIPITSNQPVLFVFQESPHSTRIDQAMMNFRNVMGLYGKFQSGLYLGLRNKCA